MPIYSKSAWKPVPSSDSRLSTHIRAGWPLACLHAVAEATDHTIIYSPDLIWQHAIVLSDESSMQAFNETILPYRPIPLGLAINILFWGSVWWLVITGIAWVWRDIRHADSLPEIRSGDSAEPFVMPEHVLCPRCGYDQRGIIAQWTDACPLQGTCTECGLQYEWLDLLKPWCVENASSQYRLVRRMIGTFVRSVLAPWRFWREIRITHEHRWRHMAAYLCAGHWHVSACCAEQRRHGGEELEDTGFCTRDDFQR